MKKFAKPLALTVVSATLISAVTLGYGIGDSYDLPFGGNTANVENVGNLVSIEDEAIPLYNKPASGVVLTPTAAGTQTFGNDKVTIDASNSSEGYVMIKYTGSVPKIKVQVTKSGLVYTYDLNARSDYEVFPFSEGNGTYSVKVFENISGTQYAMAYSQDINVKLSNPNRPFLYPNQFVDFQGNSAVVGTATQIAQGINDELAVVQAVYRYVTDNITYDMQKAATVQSGYLPEVDKILASRTGICFDYAAVMTSMLRSQNIPTKLVVGYTGDLYHAWINVYVESVGWIDNVIYFDGVNWQLMDPTFASSGKGDPTIAQYIGNGNNYQAKYAY